MKQLYIRLFLITAIMLFIQGCEKEEMQTNTVLRIYAYAENAYGYIVPVPDAFIYVDGEMLNARTDKNGNAELFNFKKKLSEIEIESPRYGRSMDIVDFRFGNEQELSTRLSRQNSEITQVSLVSPREYELFCETDDIDFEFAVSNLIVPGNELKVRIESGELGLLFEGKPDENNLVKFTKKLPYGEFTYDVKVFYRLEFDKVDKRSFCVKVLRPLELKNFKTELIENGNVKIGWDKYTRSDFESYSIYRIGKYDTEELVFKGEDPEVETFVDTSAPLGQEFSYKMVISCRYSYQYYKREIYSDKMMLSECMLAESEILSASYHPVKPYVYLLEKKSLNLTLYDYADKKILYKRPFHCEFNQIEFIKRGAGYELFIAGTNGVLYYLDENLAIAKSDRILDKMNDARLIGDRYLAVSCGYNYDKLKMFDLESKNEIDSGTIGFRSRIIRGPGINEFLTYSVGIEKGIIRFGYTENGKIERIESGYANCSNGDELLLSPAQNYMAFSRSGELMSTLPGMKNLGRVRSNVAYMGFSDDGSFIYTAHSDSRVLSEYSYPDLKLVRSFKTNGYIRHIRYVKNKLYCISFRQNPDSETSAGIYMDIIDL